MRRLLPIAAAGLAVLALLIASPAHQASAHERRTVAGQYAFVVGFITEPVFLEEPNGIDLRITNAQTNEPVEGVDKTLKADVTAGGETKTVALRARFNMPGAYTADVIPTKGGQWVFRFYGDIQGTPIDERFESGPGRFNEPQSTAELQFPVKLPTTAQLSEQLARLGPSESAAQSSGTPADAQRALDKAEDAQRSATLFGIGGILVGLIGIGVGAFALASRGRGAGRPAEPV
jgi:hypothetical protein